MHHHCLPHELHATCHLIVIHGNSLKADTHDHSFILSNNILCLSYYYRALENTLTQYELFPYDKLTHFAFNLLLTLKLLICPPFREFVFH